MAAAAGHRADGLAERHEALGAADAAWRAAPAAEVDVVLAGVRLRVRFAGDAVASALLPPLARVTRRVSGSPTAVLTAFDGSSGRPLLPRGTAGRRSGEGAHVMFEPDAPVLAVLDPVRGDGAFWTDDVRALPQWHAASPLRDLFRWALRPSGVHFVHAAVVGDDAGGVLLAGPSGSGKSTTAMLCATRGLRHLTDDYCIVTPGDAPVAHAIFATAKLADDALARLGLPAPREGGAEKIVLDPAATTVGGVADALTLCALVLPRVAERTGELVPVSPARALAALAPSTLLQLPGSRGADLAALASVVRSLPAYRLDVGPDLDAVVARVREVLAR